MRMSSHTSSHTAAILTRRDYLSQVRDLRSLSESDEPSRQRQTGPWLAPRPPFPDTRPGPVAQLAEQWTFNHARLLPERCVATFRRLGGGEPAEASRKLLTQPLNGEVLGDYTRHCMPLYNRTPQPLSPAPVLRMDLAMACGR